MDGFKLELLLCWEIFSKIDPASPFSPEWTFRKGFYFSATQKSQESLFPPCLSSIAAGTPLGCLWFREVESAHSFLEQSSSCYAPCYLKTSEKQEKYVHDLFSDSRRWVTSIKGRKKERKERQVPKALSRNPKAWLSSTAARSVD